MGDITQLAAADKELRNLKSVNNSPEHHRGRRTAAPDLEVSRRETRTYDRTAANGFKMTSEMQQGEWVKNLLKRYRRGELCCQRQKRRLTSAEVSAVIKASSGKWISPRLKKGDEFAVLMSREMLDRKREQASCWAKVVFRR
ncbi:hypothetical protein ACNKHT_11785 [Shigella flexneri]